MVNIRALDQKHTPEPWRAIAWLGHAPTTIVADTDPAEPTVVDGRNVLQYGHTTIADCQGSLRDGGNEANAARIVACVNAFRGMDQKHVEELAAQPGEMGGVVQLLAKADDYRIERDTALRACAAQQAQAVREQIEQQRDELLAAEGAYENSAPGLAREGTMLAASLMARAAIAKSAGPGMTAHPMRRPSYLKLARELRHYADTIEANCSKATPQQKRTLTQAIACAARTIQLANCRHHGRIYRPLSDS